MSPPCALIFDQYVLSCFVWLKSRSFVWTLECPMLIKGTKRYPPAAKRPMKPARANLIAPQAAPSGWKDRGGRLAAVALSRYDLSDSNFQQLSGRRNRRDVTSVTIIFHESSCSKGFCPLWQWSWWTLDQESTCEAKREANGTISGVVQLELEKLKDFLPFRLLPWISMNQETLTIKSPSKSGHQEKTPPFFHHKINHHKKIYHGITIIKSSSNPPCKARPGNKAWELQLGFLQELQADYGAGPCLGWVWDT